MAKEEKTTLKRSLNAFHLWGIAVGLVISGEYFGWSYGWASAGTLGFLITTLVVALMYLTFIFSFTELSCAIPNTGGPFAYAKRAFGAKGGFLGGFSTLIEFACAPPAIAMSIGAYMSDQLPWLNPMWAAAIAYIIFVALNMSGVKMAATFELVVTLLAIFELCVFIGVVSPGFTWGNFTANGWAGSNTFSLSTVHGIFAAIPFAIWFFLAIEGASMSAEEAKNPQVTVKKGFLWGIVTLVVLAFGVMMFAGGVGNWASLSDINDPLPQAMKVIVGGKSGWFHMLIFLGLFGLIASFHGIIMECSRNIFSLAREGYLPRSLSKVNKRQVPHRALIACGLFGILCIFSDKLIVLGNQPLTANLITLACFGSITMYIVSMFSLFKLRRSEPNLERPYKAIFYPVFPIIALVGSMLCFVAMVIYNFEVFVAFAVLFGGGYVYFYFANIRVAKREAKLTMEMELVRSADLKDEK
ncbi:MAG: ethanolamine permease [Bacteroidaceae bacterium]|nr:ethanolamine permease [Bacteroidaceae bacterium]